jgi:NADPH-dependent ferric siderophore reductase
VRRAEPLSPHLVRVTLTGPELDGLTVDQPAASVRLLLPSPGAHEVVLPRWNGNEFLLPDGRRPALRTFTPYRVDAEARELDVAVVLHGDGVASEWARTTEPGSPAAVSGPGRGYVVDPNAAGFVLAGDETAIPAITQLLGALPGGVPTHAHVEVAHPDARVHLSMPPDATVEWHDMRPGALPGDRFVAAVRDAELAAGTRVWVAGEAAAVQRVRRHLFENQSLPRGHTSIRGYWKHGRSADSAADDAG